MALRSFLSWAKLADWSKIVLLSVSAVESAIRAQHNYPFQPLLVWKQSQQSHSDHLDLSWITVKDSRINVALKRWRSQLRPLLTPLQWTRWTHQLVSGLLLAPLMIMEPASAAEQIYVSYGPLERSISVKALETYATTGQIEDDLAVYAQYADPEILQELREVLLTPIPLTPVAVSQFLYTSQGEAILQRLSGVIQTESRRSDFYAIRSALILAAAQPDGLTLLNVLQAFPTNGIRVNLARSLEIASTLEEFVEQTNAATAAVERQAFQEALSAPIVLPQAGDLRLPGGARWEKTTITLNDRSRKIAQQLPNGAIATQPRERTFAVDLYIPQPSGSLSAQTLYPAPVIVISHGLGSDRTTFAYLAEHLASHGFVVAVPEHPGSNADQLQALLNGRASEVSEPVEFVDRPLDVKYLLDELDRRSRAGALQGRFDVQNVGVLGQSFGGYTALAVAGAPLNFDSIDQSCPGPEDSFNLSFLLQCRAEDLLQRQVELRDPRIKAAIAINPVTSVVFGEAGLSQVQIPVLMIAGNADTVAPALPEQIRPFTWLSTPEKFLVLIEGATHFSALGASANNSEVVPIPAPVIGASPALAQRYVEALSVAFFKTYVANQPGYRSYLTPNYTASISREPLDLSLVQSFRAEQLTQALDGETEEPTTPPEPGETPIGPPQVEPEPDVNRPSLSPPLSPNLPE